MRAAHQIRRTSPTEQLQMLVANASRLKLELLATFADIETAAAEVLRLSRLPEPEYTPELRTLKQIGAEFFSAAYPTDAQQYSHALAFCQRNGLLQGEGGKKNSYLVDRKQVAAKLSPKAKD